MPSYKSGGNKSIVDLIADDYKYLPGQLEGSNLSQASTEDTGWGGMDSQDKASIANAGMSTPGGIGGRLIGSGLTAGILGKSNLGWKLGGAGAVLSLIESMQQRKAQEETDRVNAENQRMANIGNQLSQMGRIKLGVK